MFCFKCGKELSEESGFCTYCGVKLEYKEAKSHIADAGRYRKTEATATAEAKDFVKEIVKYFIGLVIYVLGIRECFVNYGNLLSLEEQFLRYFESDNNYDLILLVAFICTIAGLFLMLENMVEAKLVFNGAPALAVLACIFFGVFFIWAIVSLVPYIEAGMY